MKNLLSLLLVLTCLNYSQANTIDETSLIAKTQIVKADVINVTVANLNGVYTRIDLTNLNGKVGYYSEWTKEHNGLSRNLNIADLADGRYLLTVKSGSQEIKQVIKIKEGLILFSHFK